MKEPRKEKKKKRETTRYGKQGVVIVHEQDASRGRSRGEGEGGREDVS